MNKVIIIIIILEVSSYSNKSNSFITSWLNKSISRASLNEDIPYSLPVFALVHRAIQHAKQLFTSSALKFCFRVISARTRR